MGSLKKFRSKTVVALPASPAAASRFKGYAPDIEPAAVRQPLGVEQWSRGLRSIISAYHKFVALSETLDTTRNIKIPLKFIKNIEYSSEDVAAFSIILPGIAESDKLFCAGTFLSALVANGTDQEYILDLRTCPINLEDVGTENNKRLVVYGDVGNSFGADAGFTGDGKSCGSGELVLFGSAFGSVGHGMESGKITINGNVHFNVGLGMNGGVIKVNGDIFSPVGITYPDACGTSAKGGSIIVTGSVHGNIAEGLKGGDIIVKSSVHGNVAMNADSGKVTIEGNVLGLIYGRFPDVEITVYGSGRIDQQCRARVYHNGRLFWNENGRVH